MTEQTPGPLEMGDDPKANLASGTEALHRIVTSERERHPLVLGLVSPLGTPLEAVQKALRDSFQRFHYEIRVIHLAGLLDDLPFLGTLPEKREKDYYEKRMNAGDDLREAVGSGAALAALAVSAIVAHRQEDSKNTVYVVRSLKHKDEATLLRHVYGDAFTLVGVACSARERKASLAKSLSQFQSAEAETDADALIARDARDDSRETFGQQVREVFQLADVFLAVGGGVPHQPEVDRVTDSLFGAPFVTPSPQEEGMRLAYDASLRSAAIGRQVGAALVPQIGTPILIGTNEVPKPGGGQYWSGDSPDHRDFVSGEDPNRSYINRLVEELLERMISGGWLAEDLEGLTPAQLLEKANEADGDGESLLRGARAAALIEFTRCLHAEQATVINAARSGVSTLDATLYSTTFPCHECAKIIVGAGIREVFYIEPYPKSLVNDLYTNVIDAEPDFTTGSAGGEMVPFRPFVGIAPRRYERAFKAGERAAGAAIADFNRVEACPRSSGWVGVEPREAAATAAITIALTALDELNQTAAGESAADEVDAATNAEPEQIEAVVVADDSPPGSTDAGTG